MLEPYQFAQRGFGRRFLDWKTQAVRAWWMASAEGLEGLVAPDSADFSGAEGKSSHEGE